MKATYTDKCQHGGGVKETDECHQEVGVTAKSQLWVGKGNRRMSALASGEHRLMSTLGDRRVSPLRRVKMKVTHKCQCWGRQQVRWEFPL